jgi:transposase InsO family protein
MHKSVTILKKCFRRSITDAHDKWSMYQIRSTRIPFKTAAFGHCVENGHCERFFGVDESE